MLTNNLASRADSMMRLPLGPSTLPSGRTESISVRTRSRRAMTIPRVRPESSHEVTAVIPAPGPVTTQLLPLLALVTGIRGYAIFDLDGTLHPGTAGLALLNELNERGTCGRASVIRLTSFIRSLPQGHLHTREAATTAYQLWADAMTGVRAPTVRHVAHQVWERQRAELFPFARSVVDLLRQRGWTTVLLSGSPQEIVRVAAQDLGLDHAWGAEFAVDRDVYSGQVVTAPGVPGTKLALLRSKQPGFRPTDALAIGNSVTDLELLDVVGHPLAFEPDPALREAAAVRGWPIVDRTSALTFFSSVFTGCSPFIRSSPRPRAGSG